jgi:hypothetical protein
MKRALSGVQVVAHPADRAVDERRRGAHAAVEAILPDDGPQVDRPTDPDPELSGWDHQSVIPSDWCWSDEGVEAYKREIGWGPK